MKLVAARKLKSNTRDIICQPGGRLILLTSNEQGWFCEGYKELAPVWTTPLEGNTLTLTTSKEGTPWLLDMAGALSLDAQGVLQTRVPVVPKPMMELGAFAPFEDGVLFAWQHPIASNLSAPILEYVNNDGTPRWSTTPPVESIAYSGIVQMSADEGWKIRPKDPWRPRHWITSTRTLTVSGDAVLACFGELAGSGIGFGYVVSLANGALRYTTQTGPLQEVAALGGGAFLIGYQGYGSFETCDGHVAERWASHGYYVISENDVRVIELENTFPSEMHLVRLLPGGEVLKGDFPCRNGFRSAHQMRVYIQPISQAMTRVYISPTRGPLSSATMRPLYA